MKILRIAAKVASLTQPLSERPDYGTDSNPSLPRGCSEECECGGKCESCAGEKCSCQLFDKSINF